MKFYAFLFLLAPSLAQAITVANYSDAANDRFTNDPSFVGDSYDFSGVGRNTDTSRTEWATRIGENYFISANHFHPGVGDSIEFHSSNSTLGPSFTYQVAGGFRVGSTDLWIGYTSVAIDASIAQYAYTTTNANTLAETGISGSEVLMSGDRVSGNGGSPTSHTIATNNAESFFAEGSNTLSTPQHTVTFQNAATFDQIVTFKHLSGDESAPLTHEAQLQGGDSGSPLFTVGINNTLILQGTAWAVATLQGNFIDSNGNVGTPQDPLESRDATFYNYIGSYETEIDGVIVNIPAPIPEPSTFLALLSSFALLLRRNRR